MALLKLVEAYGSAEELPPNSFEGTSISAFLILLTKPEEEQAEQLLSDIELPQFDLEEEQVEQLLSEIELPRFGGWFD